MDIEEVRLVTHDPAELRRFYAGALGLRAVDGPADGFAIAAGATTVAFAGAVGETPAYHFAFNVPENKLGAAKSTYQNPPGRGRARP